jgi:tetratricopeptide (TPR) repeat protein
MGRWLWWLLIIVAMTLANLPDAKVFILTQEANYQVQTTQYDNALKAMGKAIELDPQNPALYLQRGQIYLLQYEWDKALADYNQAVELQPNNADAYFYRGVLYASVLQTGQTLHKDALTDFEHYLQLAPEGGHVADAQRYVEQLRKEGEALGEKS